MGIYLNPGNEAFREAVNSDIYIDKSALISHTNRMLGTTRKFVCVSRPRRFGKSMAADMLTAYYSRGCDSAKLFSGLEIEQEENYREHLNRHDVIRIDVQRFLPSRTGVDAFIRDIQSAVISDLSAEYPELSCNLREAAETGLQRVLEELYGKTGVRFVFVLDEWDCVFRMAKEQQEVQKDYLDFLRALFKGAPYVELVYMTGILPIKKYGEHSAVNMFDEYSMTSPKNLGTYFGFTREEVRRQCEKYAADFSEMEEWYDGYLLGENHIYNPKSVADALTWKEYQSYWTGTETYEALKVHIERDFDGLKETVIAMLGGGKCPVNIRKFQNDMTTFKSKDDVLTLLVHLGYLTYDRKAEAAYIPNREIQEEFLNAVDEPAWGGLFDALSRSDELLEHTWAMNAEKVGEDIDRMHSETTSVIKYHDENSLACVIYMAYYSAKRYYMRPVSELPTGKGFADVVYLPLKGTGRPALLVELKWNASAEGAIRQIKEKDYADRIVDYTGDILLVGINYNKKTKKHDCVIEKWRRQS